MRWGSFGYEKIPDKGSFFSQQLPQKVAERNEMASP
jgi:hypothetical protein